MTQNHATYFRNKCLMRTTGEVYNEQKKAIVERWSMYFDIVKSASRLRSSALGLFGYASL